MNVLHITDCDTGGVPAVIDTILDHLPGRALFLGNAPADFRNVDRVVAALEQKRSLSPFGLSSTLARAVEAAGGCDAQIVHGHSSFGGVYGAAISRVMRKPFIYTPHASPAMNPNRTLGERIVGLAEIISCHQASAVLACSDDEASILRRYCGDSRLRVAPNGVVAPIELPEAARPWDVLCVGRISQQKRPDLFVELAERVQRWRPATRIGWVGPGVPLPSRAVEWIGQLSENQVSAHLLNTRVYATVSDYEGLSLATLRAACAGCELALRDTVGNRSPVRMGASGFLFSDLDRAAADIVTYLDDDSRWTPFAEQRRRTQALAIFSVERMIKTLELLYAQFTVAQP